MDTQVEMKGTVAPRRRWLRCLLWGLGGLASLLVLAVIAALCWLWSWQWGDTSLKFHESWSDIERKALAEYDAYLRTDYVESVLAWDDYFNEELPSWGVMLICDYMRKAVVAPVCGQLREIAERGDARVPGVDTVVGRGVTPAIVAAQTGHFPALKALVLHGADPNACISVEQDGAQPVTIEMPVTPLLSNLCSRPDRPVAWADRREVADFLVEHGADINAGGHLIGLCCTVALMRGDAEPWFWALDKGRKPSGEDFCNLMLQAEMHLGLMEAMLKCNPGLANASHSGKTMVQSLVEFCRYDAERMEAMQPVLELLLKYGADPNRLPSGDAEADELATWLPLDFLLEHEPGRSRRRKDAPGDAPSSPDHAAWSRLCEMLKPQP